MQCPYCRHADTRVVDSRTADDGSSIRRRRECLACNERFTTYESAELLMPKVVKSDGTREPFDENKLRSGIQRALEKRPVGVEEVEEESYEPKVEVLEPNKEETNQQEPQRRALAIKKDMYDLIERKRRGMTNIITLH